MKRLIIVMFLAMLILLGAVGCSQTTQPDVPSQSGYESEEALIEAYRECVDKNDVTDAFWSAFDYTGCMAFFINHDMGDITIDEAYNALLDLEKGSEYIRENHYSFSQKWEGENGEPFQISALEEVYGLDDERKELRKYWSWVFADYEQFTPLAQHERNEDIWKDDSGFREYSVTVAYNSEDGFVSYNVNYIVRNGRYFWIFANKTLGGYGG